MIEQPSVPSPALGRGIVFRLAWLALPFLSFGYQVFAKLSAVALARQDLGLSWLLNLSGLSSFRWMVVFEVLSFIAWIQVLNAMPLSEAFPLSAISYVFVMLASWGVFHEPGDWFQILGSFAILSGVWLIARRPEGGTR